MSTIAKPNTSESSHWYTKTGEAAYEVPYADPRKGMRKTTLSDARKLGLLPSVSGLLRVLHKQALVEWMIEQACLAVLTTPKLDGEELDAFVHRVLHVDKVQDQEGQAARDRGTDMHAALEDAFRGKGVAPQVEPWILPAYRDIAKRGEVIGVERIVVGDGYAGKLDLALENNEIWLWDWKTTKKLPKSAYPEHELQLSAYAAAWGNTGSKRIRTGNVYISTVEQGEFTVCEHGDWQQTYEQGFKPLVKLWQHLNDYRP